MAPQPPEIWVKRYVWKWVPLTEEPSSPMLPQAVCTFEKVDQKLPAVRDWPRWKIDNEAQLPVDEYWKVCYVPYGTSPDETECGAQEQCYPVWTRIETPRACRWVNSKSESTEDQ